MPVKIIGLDELSNAVQQILENLKDPEPVTKRLDTAMHKYAHVRTGMLRGSIYHKENVAGAGAPYAGYEADRGGAHDYAQRAIDAFPTEEYFNEVVEPF